jgi:hypothetical protein
MKTMDDLARKINTFTDFEQNYKKDNEASCKPRFLGAPVLSVKALQRYGRPCAVFKGPKMLKASIQHPPCLTDNNEQP